jgi:hypothetical protein
LAPQNLIAESNFESALVRWTSTSNDEDYYTVTQYLDGSEQRSMRVSGAPPAQSLNVTGLINGRDYTFTVNGTNVAGTSAQSSESPVVTPNELVMNGEFSADLSGWTLGGGRWGGPTWSGSGHDRAGSLAIGYPDEPGTGYTETNWAYQTVHIPLEGTTTLSFWRRTQWNNGSSLSTQIQDVQGRTLASIGSSSNNDGAWRNTTFDASSFRGQTVRVYFGLYDNGYDRTAVNIDDVELINTP